jgi:hypothetical protein
LLVARCLKGVGSKHVDAKSRATDPEARLDEAVSLDIIDVIRSMSLSHAVAKLVESMQAPKSWKAPRPRNWCSVYHSSVAHLVRVWWLCQVPADGEMLLHYACDDEGIRLQL